MHKHKDHSANQLQTKPGLKAKEGQENNAHRACKTEERTEKGQNKSHFKAAGLLKGHNPLLLSNTGVDDAVYYQRSTKPKSVSSSKILLPQKYLLL